MKTLLFLVCFASGLLTACSKDGGKHCWEAVDGPFLGRVVFTPPLCDITKKQAEEK